MPLHLLVDEEAVVADEELGELLAASPGHLGAVTVQDGEEPFPVEVRELDGDERSEWWDRAVAAYPPYAEYQTKTDRLIPVLKASRWG